MHSPHQEYLQQQVMYWERQKGFKSPWEGVLEWEGEGICHLGSFLLSDKEKGTSLLSKTPWGLPGECLGCCTEHQTSWSSRSSHGCRAMSLAPDLSTPTPYFLCRNTERCNTEVLWQSRLGWEVTLWWSNAQIATSAGLLTLPRNQWHKGFHVCYGLHVLWRIYFFDLWIPLRFFS